MYIYISINMYKYAAFMGLVNAGLEYLMRKVVKVKDGIDGVGGMCTRL